MKTSISKAFPPKRRLSVSSTPDVATRISPTSQPLLPPELIEANIDKVHVEDDITALMQCALVSKDSVYQPQNKLVYFINLHRRL